MPGHHPGLGIRSGECFGLLGPNGAGKTTTLAVLPGGRVDWAALGVRTVWSWRDRGEGEAPKALSAWTSAHFGSMWSM